MTSSAIMGNELSKIVANNSKEVSKKNDIANTKHESFSKIMEKNNYNNRVDSKNKYENDINKRVNNNYSKEIVSNGYSKKINNNSSMGHKANRSFRKEKFAENITDAINDVAEAYKENLDITDEELMSIMESLSINIFQLPLRELAKDIVIAANGENDITSLLVNENALNDLQSMNQFFDNYNPDKRLDMPTKELESLVEEAINNLMGNKEQSIDNQILPNQDNEQLNMSIQAEESLNNVGSVEASDVIISLETIEVADGKTIDIEIVDMRNNMTSDESNIIDNTFMAATNSQLNSEITGDINLDNDTQNSSFESSNLINGENIENGAIESNITNDENTIENAIDNKIGNSEISNNDINISDSINNQVIQGKNIDNQIIHSQITEGNDTQILDTINQDMEVLNSDTENLIIKKDSKSEDSTTLSDFDNKASDIVTDKNLNINETETNTKQDSFGGNQKRQSDNKTSAETFYNKFITNLEKSFGIEEGSLLKEVSNIKEMREIVNQIIDKIKVNINKDSTTMKLNLNPEHLGKVELAVTSKAGVMTAEFVVENKTAKEAIEKGLPALIEKFEEQGLKVEAVEVRISDYDFTRQDGERRQANDYSHSDKKKKRGGKINMDDMSVDNEPPVARPRERKIMSSTGIDYTV